MSKAVTARFDSADHDALERRARQLKVRPGTLARMLVHAGLAGDTTGEDAAAAHEAIERLVRRSRRGLTGDAVALLSDAREATGTVAPAS